MDRRQRSIGGLTSHHHLEVIQWIHENARITRHYLVGLEDLTHLERVP